VWIMKSERWPSYRPGRPRPMTELVPGCAWALADKSIVLPVAVAALCATDAPMLDNGFIAALSECRELVRKPRLGITYLLHRVTPPASLQLCT